MQFVAIPTQTKQNLIFFLCVCVYRVYTSRALLTISGTEQNRRAFKSVDIIRRKVL